MTQQEFINTIINYYRISRNLTIVPGNHNIWRGVSHSISSKTEDLFALLIASNLFDNSLEFIVDKTMSYKLTGQKSIQFRPDLAIIKDDTITHILDLKMDMGYKRRYHETKEFNAEKIKYETFRNQNFESISYKTGKKSKRTLKISPNIVNQIVVISEKNGGKTTNRTDMIELISSLNWVKIYYLTRGVHPNDYNDDILVDIEINELEFNRMLNDIRANL